MRKMEWKLYQFGRKRKGETEKNQQFSRICYGNDISKGDVYDILFYDFKICSFGGDYIHSFGHDCNIGLMLFSELFFFFFICMGWICEIRLWMVAERKKRNQI
jgi:hypothetical protein